MSGTLSELSDIDTVDNVMIFIADSHRFDYLDDRIVNLGVTFKTGAAATMTASSLPSIFTGQYPASHRVWNFSYELPKRPKLFGVTDEWGFDSTMWGHLEPSENPAYRILRTETRTSLDDLDEPFVYVEHDHGGHSPYDNSLSEYTSTEYFSTFSNKPNRIREQYKSGVDASTERFLAIIDDLKTRGILDSTLVVFTADHGEVLGESNRGGLYGHGAPIIPELVYVPTVFIGAGLPEGIRIDTLLSGTDITPTALAALDEKIPAEVDGIDLWNSTSTADRYVRSDLWQQGRSISAFEKEFYLSQYAATSLWSRSGGHVVHLNSRWNRLLRSQYSNYLSHAHASVMRENWSFRKQISLLRTYGQDTITYGDPEFSRTSLDQLPQEFFEQELSGRESTRPEIDREQLEQLGYIE